MTFEEWWANYRKQDHCITPLRERHRKREIAKAAWEAATQTQWQPVVGYEDKYDVSNRGLIRRKDGSVIGQYLNSNGYFLARLSQPRKEVRVHRVVAEAFIPNPFNLPYINHIDCNPKNNNADNLEWCTQKQNLAHSRSLGRMQTDYWKDKRSPNASLSDVVANQIREDRNETGASWSALAKKYKTNKRTVGRILNGETYKKYKPSHWMPLPESPK